VQRDAFPRAGVDEVAVAACAVVAAFALVARPASAGEGLPQFADEAVARGVSYVVTQGAFGGLEQYGCGVLLADLDGDGDDDIVLSGASDSRLGLFANNGLGHFIDRTLGSGLPSLNKPSGLVAGDYDGDGDLDILLTRWIAPAALFRNEGGLAFTNQTAAAGLGGMSGAGAGASFGDFDADGDLDLAVAMRTGTLGNQMRNRFYRNRGDGTFEEIAAQLGVDDAFASFQCLLQDLDRDGDCDLYVSNDKGNASVGPRNRLFRNTLGAFVEDCGSGACIAIDSMGVATGDLDANGLIDIFCTNVGTGHALLLADASGQYIRSEQAAGVAGATTGWGAMIFDADNDSDEDLFACSMIGAPDYLWLGGEGHPMPERSAKCGLGDGDDSYALAAGDIDNDGDLDILMQSRLRNARLFVNEVPAGQRGVRLRVVGAGMNRHAIGALVEVEPALGASPTLREVVAGSAYKSMSSLVVHAGVGTLAQAARVTVRWPRVGAVREERVLTGVPTSFVVPVFPPSRLGDAAGDGRVDPVDRAACVACIAQGAFRAECAAFDFDGDCAVGAADLAQLERRLRDLDRSGRVDAADLARLLLAWGSPALDLSGDGTVDGADVGVLLAGWDG
jgi:hypothetical protein